MHSKLIYSTQIKGSDFGLWNQPPAFCLLYNAIWLPKKRDAFFPSCTCLASRMPAAHLRQTAMLGLRSPDNTRETQGEGEGRAGCWWALRQESSWEQDSLGHRHLHQGKIPFTISQLTWEPRARLVLCEEKLRFSNWSRLTTGAGSHAGPRIPPTYTVFPRMNSHLKSASQRGEYIIHTSPDNVVEAPARSLVCVTLGKLLTFSDPQFPHLQNGLFMVPPSWGCGEDPRMKCMPSAQNRAWHKVA